MDSNRGEHWVPLPGRLRGRYTTYEQCEYLVANIIFTSDCEQEATADDGKRHAADGSVKRKAQSTVQISSNRKKVKERTREADTEKSATSEKTARPRTSETAVSNGEN